MFNLQLYVWNGHNHIENHGANYCPNSYVFHFAFVFHDFRALIQGLWKSNTYKTTGISRTCQELNRLKYGERVLEITWNRCTMIFVSIHSFFFHRFFSAENEKMSLTMKITKKLTWLFWTHVCGKSQCLWLVRIFVPSLNVCGRPNEIRMKF